MIKVVTLDPGLTTGYCLSVIEDPAQVYIAYGEERLSISQFYNGLITLSPDVLICEDFEYRNRARAGLDLTPVKLIGVVELWASPVKLHYGEDLKGHDVIFQSASIGKGHYTDERLKELGIYQKGTRHGRDACRHFMQWLTFGAGYQYIQDREPALTLTDKNWVLGAYWEHRDPWR